MYLEIPFKKLNKEKAEKTLYNYLKPNNPNLNKWEVIVDIPEPISFESNFQILTDNNTIEPFNKIDPIFNIDTIGNFTKALRKLRVFLPYNIDISGIQLEKIVYGK